MGMSWLAFCFALGVAWFVGWVLGRVAFALSRSFSAPEDLRVSHEKDMRAMQSLGIAAAIVFALVVVAAVGTKYFWAPAHLPHAWLGVASIGGYPLALVMFLLGCVAGHASAVAARLRQSTGGAPAAESPPA
jgi:UDP-N-acetylmuramyl pentapeptide phosphotransferase/UDP-N-acetylglucosamine-1-phosphate transferase